MKTLVVGAGIIGVIYGWALSEAGADVTHFVRKGKAGQYKNGVELDMLDERKGHTKYNVVKYPLKCAEEISPPDGYELIIVPTAMHQIEEAIKALAPVAGKADFLIFSGNWAGPEFIDRYLPRDRYLLGYAGGGGTVRDGVYWTNLGAEVHLGAVDEKAAGKLERVRAFFERADMKPDVQENIIHWLWQHAAGVVGFSAGFAKHRDMAKFLKDKKLIHECILSTKELYRLCQERGVNLKKYPEASLVSLPVWLVSFLMKRNFQKNESMQRYTAHAASPGSLAETRAYFSEVVNTADELKFRMPHTRALGVYLD